MRHHFHKAQRRTSHVNPTETQCTVCGNRYPFWRKTRKKKAMGHVKDVWCITCQAVTPHVECSEFDTRLG